MKKLSTLFCSVLLTGAAIAQIPNAGFETWTHSGSGAGYDTPDNWGNLNAFTSLGSFYTCEKGTPGAPGSSFIKLTSKPIPIVGGVAPGIAATGTINTTTFTVTGGFPFTTRPATLAGNWQYMASGSDAGHIGILLTKWNTTTSKRDTVAFSDHTLSGMEMSWVSFSIPLNYFSGKYPDSAMILLSASGTTPVASSYLWVDSLGFAGTVPSGVVTVINKTQESTIFPNPAADVTTISYYSYLGGDVSITLTDINGKQVKQVNTKVSRGENNIQVNITGLSRGMYFVRISGGQGLEEKKLIVE